MKKVDLNTLSKEELIEYISSQDSKIEELQNKVKNYEEFFKLYQQKRFGSSSEKINPNQQSLELFNEAEKESNLNREEPQLESITYTRNKKGQKKNPDYIKTLPVEEVHYYPEEKDCPQCGTKLHEMSTEERTEIVVVPPKVMVKKHIRHILSCRPCEKHEVCTPIIKASMPRPVIPGSFASSSLIAYIMDQKYTNGLPLYRQEKQFERLGIFLPRQNLSNWVIKGAAWLEILYNHMHKLLLKNDVLHADETTVQVLKENGKEASSKSYMWLYRTGSGGPAIVLYDYQMTRAGKHPKEFLEGYKGYLHVDGYAGYHDISDVILVGCWAHARRGFAEIVKALSKDDISLAKEGLTFCNHLYSIEHKIMDLSPKEKHKIRNNDSRVILNDFLVWLKKQSEEILPNSKLGKTIKYCLNQWGNLERYLLDGRLEIDNNRAERSIKPFVIGRKNWLFSNTPKGAKSSAIIYSVIETAKENNIKPIEYLTYLFDKLPNIDINDKQILDSLLPWSDKLPENCKLNI
jgi:transposase